MCYMCLGSAEGKYRALILGFNLPTCRSVRFISGLHHSRSFSFQVFHKSASFVSVFFIPAPSSIFRLAFFIPDRSHFMSFSIQVFLIPGLSHSSSVSFQAFLIPGSVEIQSVSFQVSHSSLSQFSLILSDFFIHVFLVPVVLISAYLTISLVFVSLN